MKIEDTHIWDIDHEQKKAETNRLSLDWEWDQKISYLVASYIQLFCHLPSVGKSSWRSN